MTDPLDDENSTGDPWLDQFIAGSIARQERARNFGWGCAIFFALGLALVILCTVGATTARSHEDTDRFGHTHVFDSYCCDHKDCTKTEDDELVEMPGGAVKHLPSGKVFPPSTHKATTNANQYVCIWNGAPRCLYRRYGT